MSKDQAAQFLRDMVARQREHGNVRGQLHTIGGRECMEGSAQRVAGPSAAKHQAEREYEKATGESWIDTNDGAKRPAEVWAQAEKVADRLARRPGKEAAPTSHREPQAEQVKTPAAAAPQQQRAPQQLERPPQAHNLPSWVGAEQTANNLEGQHAGTLGGGREPHAIEGPKVPTSQWAWPVERDREPVHALPAAWGRSHDAEASR